MSTGNARVARPPRTLLPKPFSQLPKCWASGHRTGKGWQYGDSMTVTMLFQGIHIHAH